MPVPEKSENIASMPLMKQWMLSEEKLPVTHLVIDHDVSCGQIRAVDRAYVTVLRQKMRLTQFTGARSSVLCWKNEGIASSSFIPLIDDRNVVIGGQHSTVATQEELAEWDYEKDEPPETFTHVYAIILRRSTPITVRLLLAGIHQDRQQEVHATRLSDVGNL